MIGYKSGELLGMRINDLYLPDYREMVRKLTRARPASFIFIRKIS